MGLRYSGRPELSPLSYKSCSVLLDTQLLLYNFVCSTYCRRRFSLTCIDLSLLACIDILPARVTSDQYANLPYEDEICICLNIEVEFVSHILWKCPLYSYWRSELTHSHFTLIYSIHDEKNEMTLLSDNIQEFQR